jgi:hypothetical protein
MKRLSMKYKLWLFAVALLTLALTGLAYWGYMESCLNESIASWESFLRTSTPLGMKYQDAEKAMVGRYIDRAVYATAGIGAKTLYYQVDNDVEVALMFDLLGQLRDTFVQRKGVWEVWEGDDEPKHLKLPSYCPKTAGDKVSELIQWCKKSIWK